MTRRRLLLVGVLLLLLAAAAGLGWALLPPDPASRIQPGMTLGEVEAIMGGPVAFV